MMEVADWIAVLTWSCVHMCVGVHRIATASLDKTIAFWEIIEVGSI